jgi:hypothetical protein
MPHRQDGDSTVVMAIKRDIAIGPEGHLPFPKFWW